MSLWCDRIITSGILFLVLGTPFAFGSVHPWAYSTMEAVIFSLVIVWMAKVAILARGQRAGSREQRARSKKQGAKGKRQREQDRGRKSEIRSQRSESRKQGARSGEHPSFRISNFEFRHSPPPPPPGSPCPSLPR